MRDCVLAAGWHKFSAPRCQGAGILLSASLAGTDVCGAGVRTFLGRGFVGDLGMPYYSFYIFL